MEALSPSLPPAPLMRALESIAGRIEDPVTKLRFIQSALGRYRSQPLLFRRAPLLRSVALRLAAFGALDEILAEDRPGPKPSPPRAGWLLYRSRQPIYGLSALGLAFLILAFGQAGYETVRSSLERAIPTRGEPRMPAPAALERVAASAPLEKSPPPAQVPPPPRSIWLVEKRPEGELWSNGLRILTTHETRTETRRYLLFPKRGGAPVEVEKRAAGIVYHSSQSDMAPFEPDFNRSILRNIEKLLRYVRKHGNYHYLIDRFGRVYRLVVESDAASHAGKSVWADERYRYLNLNDSFLGICFESEWNPQADGIELLSPPQIQSGLNLTDMLRSRHGIPDSNCVTHGLISVNPANMLIGHHLDGAKGFPFEALRLTDKYHLPLPSIFEFGFSYDEHFVQSMKGELWPGLKGAELKLAEEARRRGLALSALQKQLRQTYLRYLERVRLAKGEAGPKSSLLAGPGSP